VNARVIVNPASGGGRGSARVQGALQTLREHGWDLDVRETTGPGHASDLAVEAAEREVPVVLAAGGDGTTYEVVNGLFPAKGTVPRLGLLPVGTGNSFLRDFAITDLAAAVQAILRKQPRACDVVRATHAQGAVHYVNLLSLGFSAEVGALTNRRFKGLGLAGYALATVGSLVRLDHPCFPYALDDGPRETAPVVLLSFCNSRFTGGTMQMAPAADPTDGALDVIHVGAMRRRRLLGAFPKIYRGTHVHLPEVRTTTARSVRFDLSGPVPCMIDGEVCDLTLERLDVLPGALQVFA